MLLMFAVLLFPALLPVEEEEEESLFRHEEKLKKHHILPDVELIFNCRRSEQTLLFPLFKAALFLPTCLQECYHCT